MTLGSNSVFSYCVYKGNRELRGGYKHVQIGNYSICMSPKTLYEFHEEGDMACLIIGLATCVSEDMKAMDWLWKHCQSINSIIKAEYFLGGKYMVFIRIKDQYYMIGDATCSVPVYYNEGGDICSSFAYQIAEELHSSVDETLLKIREGGDASKTMPYDLTIWKDIKRLLPNHYLCLSCGKAVRFVNQHVKQSVLTPDEATENIMPYMKRLADYYMNRFSVACALTSGRDSRAVLAVLGCNKQMPIYTMRHNEFSEMTPDIVVPKQIADYIHLNYQQIKDVKLTEEDFTEADTVLGKGNYSSRTLMLAHTINHYFGKNAVINGDIIGQVGKCSLHRDIPYCFASPSYFLCKLHNYTKEAKEALKLWMKDIKQSDEHVNSFDLFSIENRMGVWAANENEVYNLIGQYYLNIFNSRSIMYEWTRVDRKKRKVSAIHLSIIKMLHPELLNIPFESASTFEKVSKYNGLTYLIASYLKHYMEKIKSR